MKKLILSSILLIVGCEIFPNKNCLIRSFTGYLSIQKFRCYENIFTHSECKDLVEVDSIYTHFQGDSTLYSVRTYTYHKYNNDTCSDMCEQRTFCEIFP